VIDAAVATVDLRRDPLAAVRSVDLRAPDRDFWADETALWDRLTASWAGLDEGAWKLPGAAKSDAGGPDWSLQDHVGHLADWLEIAVDYLERVLAGGPWPADSDYDGGDFDRFNERRREPWASLPAVELLDRLSRGHAAALATARRLPVETIRGDEAWGWVYMVLHGHAIDHLQVIEPWTDRLRDRQVRNDPFAADPRPFGDGGAEGIAAFWAAEASVFAQFDRLVRAVPVERWEERGPTPDWTLKDHVAHMAAWFDEAADVFEEHATTRTWRPGPAEGIDAWNARALVANRGLTATQALDRFEAGHRRLSAAVRATAPRELASPEGGDWAWECLHGHVRNHLAMIGGWCARVDWPPAGGATAAGPRA
jgi:hypothetical protein